MLIVEWFDHCWCTKIGVIRRDSAVFATKKARAWPASIMDGSVRLTVVDVPLFGWFWPWSAAIEAAVGVLLSGHGGLMAVAAVPPVLAA